MRRWNRVGVPLARYANSSLRGAGQQQELQPLSGFFTRHLSIRTILKGTACEGPYLRELNRAGQHIRVVQEFESGAVQPTEDALGEYIKALVKLDRLDNTRLLSTIQRGAAVSYTEAAAAAQASSSAQQVAQALPSATNPLLAAASQQVPGTANNPLIISSTEPGFFTQIARLIKHLGLAFILVTAGSALIEDRSLTKPFTSKSMNNNLDLKPQYASNTTFADVMGVDEAKAELQEIVQFLKDPSKFTNLGGHLPKGVLLAGPPGTGKTMLARAIAGEAGVPFFYCSGSEFEEMYVGVGARRVRDLFAAAKKHAPCIIFMDEIDAIGGHRNPHDQQHMRMTLNQLLVELDGFKPSEGVIVVAATNFPEALDKALVRPGRFDRHVVVPAPDVEGRRQILETHCKKIPLAPDVDIQVIARGTPGFSGADLANLINVAALHAAKEDHRAVDMQDMEYAIDRIMMGPERKSAVITERSRRLTAYHEGGHALVALFTDGADPVHKATIIPRGVALGMVTQLPEEDQLGYSYKQLLARLDVCMGGRVAEELIFGHDDITTGASSDLKQATQLARAMVTKYGMSDKIGQVCLDYEDNGRSMSSETRARVEEEVRGLVQSAYERAKSILTAHEAELHSLAQALLDKETLSGEQIQEMIRRSKQAAAAAVKAEPPATPPAAHGASSG